MALKLFEFKKLFMMDTLCSKLLKFENRGEVALRIHNQKYDR